MAKMSAVEKFFVNRKNRSLHEILADLDGTLAISNVSKVLEVGAGAGKLSLLLNEKYHPASLHITDVDEEQINLAEKNVKERYSSVPTNLRLEKADLLDLRYSEESFDVVFAIMVFHHVGGKNLDAALDNASSVLKVGGQLVYSEMFHKRKIKDYLTRNGFTISYSKSHALGLGELVVATKSLRNPDGECRVETV